MGGFNHRNLFLSSQGKLSPWLADIYLLPDPVRDGEQAICSCFLFLQKHRAHHEVPPLYASLNLAVSQRPISKCRCHTGDRASTVAVRVSTDTHCTTAVFALMGRYGIRIAAGRNSLQPLELSKRTSALWGWNTCLDKCQALKLSLIR